MRLLLVCPFQPHPDADHGGGVYVGLLLRELLGRAEVATVHYTHRGDLPPFAGVHSFTTPRLRAAEMAPGARWAQRLRLLWEWGVRRTPLEAAKIRSPEFRHLLRRAVAEFEPDVVLVEFVVLAWCLAELRGSTTVLTDHERGASVPRRFGPGKLGAWRDRRLWPAFVRRFYPMADLVQALTAEDAAALSAATGLHVEVRAPMIEVPAAPVDPGAAPPVMLFFGDYLHHPNPETAVVLAREVLPLVRRRVPEAELWLAGPRATPNVTALADLPGVRVLGFVEDFFALMAGARCMVAPVFSGSGVRVKAMAAMAHGLPLVTNRLGLQGTAPPVDAVATGESPAELAAAALRFLTDRGVAVATGTAARRYAEARLGGATLARQQLERFASLLG